MSYQGPKDNSASRLSIKRSLVTLDGMDTISSLLILTIQQYQQQNKEVKSQQ